MREKYYALTLEDYSVPAFVSCTRQYFGTLKEITDFINSLRNEAYHKELVEAFDKYCAGDKKVKYRVAYNYSQLIEPVTLIATYEHEIGEMDYDHINIWGCPYYMRFKNAQLKHYWFKCGKIHFRAVKAKIEDLQYQSCSGNWFYQEEAYWGFPNMMVFKPPYTFTRLAVIEKCLPTIEALKEDDENFDPEKDVDLTGYFNEIFGNG